MGISIHHTLHYPGNVLLNKTPQLFKSGLSHYITADDSREAVKEVLNRWLFFDHIVAFLSFQHLPRSGNESLYPMTNYI